MRKQDLEVGGLYARKYSPNAAVLVSIGGYENDRWGIDREKTRRYAKKHVTARGQRNVSDHLLLQLAQGVEVTPEILAYTADMFDQGVPLPEGTHAVASSSKELLHEWHVEVMMRKAAKQRQAKAEAEREHRMTVVAPEVREQLKRLGLNKYVSDYSTRLEFTFAEFLDMARRIPSEES